MRYESLAALFLLIGVAAAAIFSAFANNLVHAGGSAAADRAAIEVHFGFIFIDGISGNVLTVRNIGNSAVYSRDVSVYVNGIRKGCMFTKFSIEPRSAVVCLLDEICTGRVRVAGPASEDSISCF